jgi:hypothetical protein
MRRFRRTALVALSLLPPLGGASSPVLADPIGLFTDFNVLVLGNFSASNSDVQGRLGAGGNISLNNYSVGDRLTGDLVGGDTLVAGGYFSFPCGGVF